MFNSMQSASKSKEDFIVRKQHHFLKNPRKHRSEHFEMEWKLFELLIELSNLINDNDTLI